MIYDKDNVSWHEAPLPRRWHGCKPQTWGGSDGHWIERCACGAMRIDLGNWFDRNSRRKKK